MKFRKLRIAWSVIFGILCILLIPLWVRSYTHDDILVKKAHPGRVPVLESSDGSFTYWLRQDYWSPSLEVPYWLPVLTFMVFAASPWIRQLRWHFTLRTLLIATTLVAVVLGVAAYFSK
jgi:hypothetical protein